MRPISVHVSETAYRDMKALADQAGRPVAELIREAMAEYLERTRRAGRSVLDIPPHRSGSLLRRWTRAELADEMIAR